MNDMSGRDRPIPRSHAGGGGTGGAGTGGAGKGGGGDKPGFFERAVGLLGSGLLATLALLLGTALLAALIYKGLGEGFLATIATNESARALITFLFAVSTVGIAIITVMGAFLANGDKDVLAARFQQAKDVLTLLIGVFGTIVGFYFGSARNETAQPAAAVQSEVRPAPGGPPPAPAGGNAQQGAGSRAP